MNLGAWGGGVCVCVGVVGWGGVHDETIRNPEEFEREIGTAAAIRPAESFCSRAVHSCAPLLPSAPARKAKPTLRFLIGRKKRAVCFFLETRNGRFVIPETEFQG